MSHAAGTETHASEPARKPRRRTRVAGGKPVRHEVKVTPEEEGRLLQLSLRYGVSIPKLLVDAALAGGSQAAAASASEREALLRQLFATQRTLAGIGNNVNQIARHLNVTDEVSQDLTATHARVREVVEEIAAAVTELRVMSR